MNIDYTPNAERAIEGAVAAARQFNHSYVGTEHILCSILAIPNCEACRRFERLDLDPEELRLQLEQMIGRGGDARVLGDIPFTARTRKILELAKIEAQHLQCDQVGTEHLVIAMLREGESAGAQVLFGHGLDPDKFIGAGASGLFLAHQLVEQKEMQVYVFEKNKTAEASNGENASRCALLIERK